jgi:hypothetical protein
MALCSMVGGVVFARKMEAVFLRNVGVHLESILGPSGTSATSGLLYLPRVTVNMENSVESKLVEET